jgi:hypothetical protein
MSEAKLISMNQRVNFTLTTEQVETMRETGGTVSDYLGGIRDAYMGAAGAGDSESPALLRVSTHPHAHFLI